MGERLVGIVYKELIRKTKANSLSRVDSEEFGRNTENVIRDFLSGKLTLKEMRNLLLDEPGVLLVDTPDELGEVLYQLGLQSIAKKSVDHEGAHWRAAKDEGFEAKVGVRFVKRGTFGGFRNCVTWIDIPEDFEDDMARQGLRRVITAPGIDMSGGDERMLPELASSS